MSAKGKMLMALKRRRAKDAVSGFKSWCWSLTVEINRIARTVG